MQNTDLVITFFNSRLPSKGCYTDERQIEEISRTEIQICGRAAADLQVILFWGTEVDSLPGVSSIEEDHPRCFPCTL